MQALLDGFYNVAMQLVQKIRRLKLAMADLDELNQKQGTELSAQERERFEKAIRHHTTILAASISEIEDMIAEAKDKLWHKAMTNERPHYAEMAMGGDEE